MADRERLEALFREQGDTDFRWMDPRNIVVAQWVRMKCTFGCPEYGRNASCPPSVPSVSECREWFAEYTSGVVFHFEKAVERPEDRHAWTKEVSRGLVALERAVFLAGYQKAFMLMMDSCGLCAECAETREKCKQPRLARPTPEALGVDVFTTVRRLGYPIQVLRDTTETMNRFAFLLVE